MKSKRLAPPAGHTQPPEKAATRTAHAVACGVAALGLAASAAIASNLPSRYKANALIRIDTLEVVPEVVRWHPAELAESRASKIRGWLQEPSTLRTIVERYFTPHPSGAETSLTRSGNLEREISENLGLEVSQAKAGGSQELVHSMVMSVTFEHDSDTFAERAANAVADAIVTLAPVSARADEGEAVQRTSRIESERQAALAEQAESRRQWQHVNDALEREAAALGKQWDSLEATGSAEQVTEATKLQRELRDARSRLGPSGQEVTGLLARIAMTMEKLGHARAAGAAEPTSAAEPTTKAYGPVEPSRAPIESETLRTVEARLESVERQTVETTRQLNHLTPAQLTQPKASLGRTEGRADAARTRPRETSGQLERQPASGARAGKTRTVGGYRYVLEATAVAEKVVFGMRQLLTLGLGIAGSLVLGFLIFPLTNVWLMFPLTNVWSRKSRTGTEGTGAARSTSGATARPSAQAQKDEGAVTREAPIEAPTAPVPAPAGEPALRASRTDPPAAESVPHSEVADAPRERSKLDRPSDQADGHAPQTRPSPPQPADEAQGHEAIPVPSEPSVPAETSVLHMPVGGSFGYEKFFGLEGKPFSLLPDPSFLYMSRQHSLSFAVLQYGLASNAGLAVLTGEIGCGKTTLLRHLLNEVDSGLTVGLLSNTHPSFRELLQWISAAFGLEYERLGKVALHQGLVEFMIEEYRQNRRVVLIVDEAQNLGPAALEELRMLSNVNVDDHLLLQLVLVGQPQLRKLLARPDLVQVAQRIAADYSLGAFEPWETREYITHRLEKVRGDPAIFEEATHDLIHRASAGVPRVINVLCDTALVYAYGSQQRRVGPALMREVIKDRQRLRQPDSKALDLPSGGLADLADQTPVRTIASNPSQVDTPMHSTPLLGDDDEFTPFRDDEARELFSGLRDRGGDD